MFCRYSAMKKNIANIENVTAKATMLAPMNDRDAKKRKSTTGTAERRSMATKAASEAMEATSSATIPAEPQPHELPSTSASTRAVRPSVSVTMPGTSTRRDAVSSRDSRVANSVTATATTATGTLRKKIARQLTSSVSQPPTSGPTASAIADTPA